MVADHGSHRITTATSMIIAALVLSARGMKASARDRAGNDRGKPREDEPARKKPEKRNTAEAKKCRKPRPRDRTHRRHHRQDRRGARAAGYLHQGSGEGSSRSSARRAPVPRPHCNAPRTSGWTPFVLRERDELTCRTMRQPASPVFLWDPPASHRGGSAGGLRAMLFRFLCGLGHGFRRRNALNVAQPTEVKR